MCSRSDSSLRTAALKNDSADGIMRSSRDYYNELTLACHELMYYIMNCQRADMN